MPRGLDHIVHAVRDLDAAADLYRRMGFTVGARNRHPWGTHNHIVQQPGFFIELLTVAEPEKLGSDGFSRLFGAFNRDFLAHSEGLSLLILESSDAAADERAFKTNGIAGSDVMRFEREGRRPDGSAVKVAFSLVFAKDKAAPGIHFCTCQQHYPENFWNPAFQKHANGVQNVRGVAMVAADPAAHRDFAMAYAGSEQLYTEPGEISVLTPRGALSLMTPDRFAAAFGVAAPTLAHGPRLACIRLATADVGRAREMLAQGGVAIRNHRDGFVVAGHDAMGAAFTFEPPK